MGAWQFIILAGIVWFIVFYKFKAMWRGGGWRNDSVTFHFWSFAVCMAVGVTFLIEPVYLAFNRLAGLPNLAWLLLNIAFALATYFTAAGCYRVLGRPQPPLIRWSLPFVLTIFVVLYIFGIASLPEKPERVIPETLAEAVFMQTLYLYIAILSVIPMTTYTRLFRAEKVVSARLRWLVAMVATLAAAAVMVCKILLTFLAYQNPATPALNTLHLLVGGGITVVIFIIPIAFLPHRAYMTLARPIEFVAKVKAVRELHALKTKLDRFCPPVIDERAGWRAILSNLDFYLYRNLIAILDAKQTLAGYAQSSDGLILFPVGVGLRRESLRNWDEQDLERARLLHCALQTVDDHTEFGSLVQAYQGVSRTASRRLTAAAVGEGR
jgi:hypothetical protein